MKNNIISLFVVLMGCMLIISCEDKPVSDTSPEPTVEEPTTAEVTEAVSEKSEEIKSSGEAMKKDMEI